VRTSLHAHRPPRSPSLAKQHQFSRLAQPQRAPLPAIDPRVRCQVVSSPFMDPKEPTRVRPKLQLYPREDTTPTFGSQLLRSQVLPMLAAAARASSPSSRRAIIDRKLLCAHYKKLENSQQIVDRRRRVRLRRRPHELPPSSRPISSTRETRRSLRATMPQTTTAST
jgi:hypothetical protein